MKFVPNHFAGGISNVSKRKCYMLVVDVFEEYVSLINISKIEDKPNCFTYKYNVPLKYSCPPLYVPSFAKTNDRYLLELFDDIDKLPICNGKTIDCTDYNNVIKQYRELDETQIEQITLTKEDIYYEK